MATLAAERQDLIDRLSTTWKPEEIRSLGATLLRLADSLSQEWEAPKGRSAFSFRSQLARIEHNALNLAATAHLLTAQRALRSRHLDTKLFGEPAWEMLLDLFVQYAGGAKVSTTSLCLASQVPTSTALRYIDMLEEAGYVTRSNSEFDKRLVFVGLTDKGVVAVGKYLEEVG